MEGGLNWLLSLYIRGGAEGGGDYHSLNLLSISPSMWESSCSIPLRILGLAVELLKESGEEYSNHLATILAVILYFLIFISICLVQEAKILSFYDNSKRIVHYFIH